MLPDGGGPAASRQRGDELSHLRGREADLGGRALAALERQEVAGESTGRSPSGIAILC